ncbi:cation-translocating P-type ATPase [Rhodococcus aetherivorans]|uniref:cation-translocating P-type ATPase n=1 Tax=Rhodococcus aetherivorans TaxID=191292 RepID=UPI001E2A006F|nr:cation-translocating P-type ATPase [Rhodococcus aetherivorans]UGQ42423.1 cation-translocating P-type ATPase [Rhodococcus aetherivorans]
MTAAAASPTSGAGRTGWLSAVASVPRRGAQAGTRLAVVGAGAGVNAAIVGAATVAGVGTAVLRAPAAAVTAPSSTAVRAVAELVRESPRGAAPRRRGSTSQRIWLGVRGLNGPDGDRVAERMRQALHTVPGVEQVQVHRQWSRAVLTPGPVGPDPQVVCRIVDGVERDCGLDRSGGGRDLPGDDLVLTRRLVAAAAATAGLTAALAGRYLRLPRLPGAFAAPVVAADYQPRIRAAVETAVGSEAADLVFALASTAVYTATLAPPSLAVETALRVLLVAEARAGRRVWQAVEPALARHIDSARALPRVRRPTPPRPGPIERHGDRAGLAGAGAAAALGALTRNPATAGAAVLVAAPRATRAARESFAAVLGSGLAERGTLVLRPAVLRRLDRVDAVVVDPRALYTSHLSVTRVLEVPDRDRTRVWDAARRAVEAGALGVGWHPVSAVPGLAVETDHKARVLVGYVHDRFAAAVLAAARSARTQVVSVEDDGLRSLRTGFDRLDPAAASMDKALRAVVERLQADGRTVAVLTADAPETVAVADVAVGVFDGGDPPPWGADVLVPDLTGAWRLLAALPAARTASRRGVDLSLNASALGALLMLPGVPGSGPESVTASAVAALWTGRSLARAVLAEPLPQPRSGHDWHALSPAAVRRLLPPPDGDRPPPRPRRTVIPFAAGPIRLAWRTGGRPVRSVRGFAGAVRTELADPLTPVLATCAAASAVLGSPLDAILVGSVLLVNAGISATQRLRAEKVLRELLQEQDPPARRLTGVAGHRRYVATSAAALERGDLIEVRPGEVAPADGRLILATGVEVDESSLTGESLPVVKQTDPTPGAPLAERTCMLYAGTTVLTGTAVALVTSVGAATETRRATAMAPGKVREVGLQSQLSVLTRRALPVSFGGGVLVTALGLLRGTGVRAAVTSGVAVTVAAVPEGLPLVATLAQMAAARRLTSSAALVRTPRSVEALGRVQVVCFDKTGTLSENRLRVTVVEPAEGFTRAQVLAYAARTGHAANGGPPDHATDIAVVEAAEGAGATDGDGNRSAYLPFRSGRAYAAAVAGRHLAVKGAPEVMLGAFTARPDTLAQRVQAMAAAGLRVIAVGGRELSDEQVRAAADDPDTLADLATRQLAPVGLIGLADTPRADAAGLLPALREQGLGVRLITGDHPVTAIAISRELGLDVTDEQVLAGSEWEAMSSAEQQRAVGERLVFARMSPEHKVQIVQTLERTGRVVAMVGDGANDAAAIRAASVGIGVASRGSDPARGAADVVLLDGRVGALLDALAEGRQLWQRVHAAVAVLLGGNAGEVAFALIGSVLTGHSPLNARQLLLVNMLTDALPAAALAVSTPRANGHHPAAAAVADQSALMRTVAVRGTTTAAGATAAWLMARGTGTHQRASTVALIALVGTQLGQTLLDSRSPLVVGTVLGSLATMAMLVSTPGVSGFLGCVPVGPVGWTQGLGSAAVATALAALAPETAARIPGIGAVVHTVTEAGNLDEIRRRLARIEKATAQVARSEA